MKRLSLLLLAGLAGAAQAQDFVTTSQFGGSVSQLEVVKAQTSAAISNAAGSAKAVGRVDFLGPAGRTASAQLEAQIARKAVLTAAAKTLARATGYGAAAVAAYEVYEQFRVKGDTQGGGGGLVQDPGQAPEAVTSSFYDTGVCQSETPHAWVACQFKSDPAGDAGYVGVGGYRIDYVSDPGGGHGTQVQIGTSKCVTVEAPSSCWVGNAPLFVPRYEGLHSRCPMVIHPLDPAFNIPAGSPKGADGKCQTGQYTQGKTAQEAADMVDAANIAANLDLAKLFRESIGFGIGDIPADAPKKVTEVTPATIPGPSTTTAHPDGSKTEVATEHVPAPAAGFQTTRFQTIPWWMKSTTTTISPQGQPTGTTTTTNKPGETAAGQPGTGGNPEDPCVSDPGRLGCIGLGTIPPEPDLPTRAIAMTADPDSGWGAFNAACPTPRTISVAGRSLTLDNVVLCDWLGMLRFIVIGFASIASIRIILGGVTT